MVEGNKISGMDNAFVNFEIVSEDDFLINVHFSPYIERIKNENKKEIGKIIRSTLVICDEFISAFDGCFGDASLYTAFFRDYVTLPWYRSIENEENKIEFVDEIQLIARRMIDEGCEDLLEKEYTNNVEKMRIVKDLAVSGLLQVDEFLRVLLTGNVWAAFDAYDELYQSIFVIHGFIRSEVLPSHSDIAVKASNAYHNGPNGFRAKRVKIQEIWASGKYSSRDICAEQESSAIGMSFSTARKALRRTPNPT